MRKKTRFLYCLLAITFLCMLYYVLHAHKLAKELNSSKLKLQVEIDKNNDTTLLKPDSILLSGNLSEALKAYKAEQKKASGDKANNIQFRIQLIDNFLSKKKEYEELSSSMLDSVPHNIDEISAKIHRAYVHKIDSIDFAISKAKMQITNLKHQLRNKNQSAYITFENSNGQNIYYVGETKNKLAHGKGIGFYDSGSRYEGEWSRNNRQGTGTFIWLDGQRYEGSYLNDKRHGIGTYFWPNGEKYQGEWENGFRNGKGVYYGADGSIITKGIWEKDELIEVDKNKPEK